MITAEYSTYNPTAEFHPLESPQNDPRKTYQEIIIVPNLGRFSRLENTGFNLPLESTRFFNNYNQEIRAGRTRREALQLTTEELEVNVRTFIREYIEGGLVLPHLNRIEEVGGARRMVGNNGQPVVNAVTAKERYGATLEASIAIEDSMVQTEVDSPYLVTRVLNSPEGWSGLVNEKGKKITYRDNQILIFWSDQGVLRGLTLVTDLSLAQSKRLSLELGVSKDLLIGNDEKEKLAAIVRNPALLSFPRLGRNPAEYVFERMLTIRGMGDFRLIQADGSIEYRPVKEMLRDIRRFDELLHFNQTYETCIKEMKQFILGKAERLGEKDVQLAIIQKIEETILQITRAYLKGKEKLRKLDNVIYFNSYQGNRKDDDFEKEVAYLRSRAGCNGGGDALSFLRGASLGSNQGRISSSGGAGLDGFCIKCGACGRVILRVVRPGEKCPKCPAVRECA